MRCRVRLAGAALFLCCRQAAAFVPTTDAPSPSPPTTPAPAGGVSSSTDCTAKYGICDGVDFHGFPNCCGDAVCTESKGDALTSVCTPSDEIEHEISFAYYFANMQDPMVRAYTTQNGLVAALKKFSQLFETVAFFINYNGAMLDTVAVTMTRYDDPGDGTVVEPMPYVTGFLFNSTMKGSESTIKTTIQSEKQQEALMAKIMQSPGVYGMYDTTYIAHGELLSFDGEYVEAYVRKTSAGVALTVSWLLAGAAALALLPMQFVL